MYRNRLDKQRRCIYVYEVQYSCRLEYRRGNVNDDLTMTGVLEADAIAPRIASEVTVNGDLVVSGAFLVDAMKTREANQVSIDDNLTISGTTVANNLLYNGILSFGSNSSITGLTKGSIGLGNVDNSSDASKPFEHSGNKFLGKRGSQRHNLHKERVIEIH